MPLPATISCGNQESFSIETHTLSFIVRLVLTAPTSSYTNTIYYQSIKVLQKIVGRTYERTYKRLYEFGSTYQNPHKHTNERTYKFESIYK